MLTLAWACEQPTVWPLDRFGAAGCAAARILLRWNNCYLACERDGHEDAFDRTTSSTCSRTASVSTQAIPSLTPPATLDTGHLFRLVGVRITQNDSYQAGAAN